MGKEYRIFISHAWKYHEDYERLVKMLNNAPYFKWKNFSVPKHDPLIDPEEEAGKKKLIEELKNQIRPVHVVIIISGMYVAYRYWIQKEIDIALEFSKPIVGIKPWGQEKVPQIVQKVSCRIVGWNTKSIIDAIRDCSI